MDSTVRLPLQFYLAVRRCGARFTEHALAVSVRRQRMVHFHTARDSRRGRRPARPEYVPRNHFVVSTSRFGIGQIEGSNRTPLGLHRIADKIGGGWPVGAVFRSRELIGFTWQGASPATIAHRILWLDGLEPGFNRGDNVDSHARYIYLHGTGDETSLGRPASCGCVHLAAADLLPLYDRVPRGTLVWIEP